MPPPSTQTQTELTPDQQVNSPHIQGQRGQSNQKKRGGGRAPGSQGYSAADCTALVAAVKKILPLGSQEWSKVQDIYNCYASENHRMTREADPLKIKFRNLVDSKKPTGETICPPWIREAKLVDLSIRERAFHNALVDQESGDSVNHEK